MQFLRTFGLLLLLMMSGNTGMSSSLNSLTSIQEEVVDLQFTEVSQDLSESILVTPAEVLVSRTFLPAVLVPEYLCPGEVSRANNYLLFSRTIIPSLGIADIIFPFHSFF